MVWGPKHFLRGTVKTRSEQTFSVIRTAIEYISLILNPKQSLFVLFPDRVLGNGFILVETLQLPPMSMLPPCMTTERHLRHISFLIKLEIVSCCDSEGFTASQEIGNLISLVFIVFRWKNFLIQYFSFSWNCSWCADFMLQNHLFVVYYICVGCHCG